MTLKWNIRKNIEDGIIVDVGVIELCYFVYNKLFFGDFCYLVAKLQQK